MTDEELAMLDALLDKYTPRMILQNFGQILENRASAVLDTNEPVEEPVRQDALGFRVSGRNLRQFAIRA